MQEHIFGEFVLAPLTFGTYTYPTDTFPSAYHYPSMSIPISQPLNCSPILAVDNLQHFQHQIGILDNPRWRRFFHFRFPYTLQSSDDLFWCRETEAHIPILLVCSLPVYKKKAQDTMKKQTLQDVYIEAII